MYLLLLVATVGRMAATVNEMEESVSAEYTLVIRGRII